MRKGIQGGGGGESEKWKAKSEKPEGWRGEWPRMNADGHGSGAEVDSRPCAGDEGLGRARSALSLGGRRRQLWAGGAAAWGVIRPVAGWGLPDSAHDANSARAAGRCASKSGWVCGATGGRWRGCLADAAFATAPAVAAPAISLRAVARGEPASFLRLRRASSVVAVAKQRSPDSAEWQ